jgi:hypothetical protein
MKNLNHFSLFTGILVLAFVNLSCSSDGYERNIYKGSIKAKGDITTVNLDLPSFHSIKLKNSANVHITQGKKQSVKIEGQENVIEVINKEVKSGVWSIHNTQRVKKAKRVNIYITIPTVELIHVSGSGNLKGKNTFKNLKDVELAVAGSGNLSFDFEGEDVVCKVSGSGNMNLNLIADEIDSAISGSGNIEIAGEASSFTGRISGSGTMAGRNLQVNVADINITGSGDCEIGVSDLLTTKVSGSGSVYYSGNPKVDIRTTGSGKVRSLGI